MSLVPLETRVPNTVCLQAVNGPVPDHTIVLTLACHAGQYEPDDVRKALDAAVERGDVERVDGGYQPGEWDEWECPRAR